MIFKLAFSKLSVVIAPTLLFTLEIDLFNGINNGLQSCTSHPVCWSYAVIILPFVFCCLFFSFQEKERDVDLNFHFLLFVIKLGEQRSSWLENCCHAHMTSDPADDDHNDWGRWVKPIVSAHLIKTRQDTRSVTPLQVEL